MAYLYVRCTATRSTDLETLVLSVLSLFTVKFHFLRVSLITGSRDSNHCAEMLTKSVSSAYIISKGRPISDVGLCCASCVCLTSRRAASRYTANRKGDKLSPCGVLGIDMSKAFDTIQRDCLLEVLQSFLDEDEMRMIRVLLAGTTISVRFGCATSDAIETTIGTSDMPSYNRPTPM